ncbi:lipase [Streptomyces sp. SID5473]|uniref:Lipase n=1 Tax=Streptomyces tsukubensis (strain DSM 42081 / NBRC 108919 / NRRL 18488 / 9993) TaxID=1114943 RepID=A0A7G3UI06_STRT9|nr:MULTISPECIES: lipase [Streptomyces]MYS67329.1 lipase [Streptomyces sp. SID5473]QKM70073.1 lipase [Streptomyces tsukubensis NRRL18488]TAI45951.1 lipase [Streptomyces tsukubensis]
MKRRTLVTGSAALLATAVTAPGPLSPAAAAVPRRAAAPVRFDLPAPSGPYPIGTVALHLRDTSRPDPWTTGRPCRELMISIWYPAAGGPPAPVVPWMPPRAADSYLGSLGLPPGAVLLGNAHGRERAPFRCAGGPLPVVVYSPGSNASRSFGTGIVEDLAGHGYVVVTVDHPYDAAAVEFPGGRVETTPPGGMRDYAKGLAVRTDDLRFVLDRLAAIRAGDGTDLPGGPLPAGLREALDLRRIGMIGHSLGGAATAAAMHTDGRIAAGASLDGGAAGPVVDAGLDRPFLVVDTYGKGGMETNPALRTFWSKLRGWRRRLTVAGAAHQSFGDEALILPQVAPLLGMDRATLEGEVGTIPTHRAQAFQRAYPRAFFDLHLRGRGRLLDGPSRDFPEVRHQR